MAYSKENEHNCLACHRECNPSQKCSGPNNYECKVQATSKDDTSARSLCRNDELSWDNVQNDFLQLSIDEHNSCQAKDSRMCADLNESDSPQCVDNCAAVKLCTSNVMNIGMDLPVVRVKNIRIIIMTRTFTLKN